MTTLNELYREAVLEHNKHPRNVGKLTLASHQAYGNNPLCGDDVTVFVNIQDEIIQSLHWTGRGCAVSTASTSIMSEILQGKAVHEALETIQTFMNGLYMKEEIEFPFELEDAKVLAGVKEFPIRIKCALLGWKTAEAALTQNVHTVSTES